MNSPRGVLTNTWTFTADGRATTTMTTGAGTTVTLQGTYTDGGGTITQTITSGSEPGRTRTYPNPVGVPYRYTVSGDTLTVSGANAPGPMVFTRQGSS